MNKGWIYLILVFFIAESVFGLVVNEVMYHPNEEQGGNKEGEWIELYNELNDSVNLSLWNISDSKYIDSFECCFHENCSLVLEPGGYAVITDQDSTIDDYYDIPGSRFCVDDNSIGNGLSDKGDSIKLISENETLVFSYEDNIGGDGNGESIERKNPLKEEWGRSLVVNGTPGIRNNIYEDEETVKEEKKIDYSKLSINEILPNPKGDDDAEKPEGEWVEIVNSGKPIDIQGLSLMNDDGKEIVIVDINTNGGTVVDDYLVVYPRKGRGFLKNDKDEIYLRDREGNVIDSVSYIDSSEGSSFAKVEDVWIKTMPTPFEDNVNYSDVDESVFLISKIYDMGSDNSAKFGQTLRVLVSVYKGDETKSSASLWVENKKGKRVSKYSKFNVYERYSNVTMTVPIQLYPNCEEDYDDGSHLLKIGWTSGYEERDELEFYIEGISNDVCIGKKVKKNEIKVKDFTYSLVSYPKETYSDVWFESEIELVNNEKVAHEFEIYSYVYRGSKCYSGEREENKKSIVVHAKSTERVNLSNVVIAEPGEYKFKVRIKKDDLKGLKEMTVPIVVGLEVNNISQILDVQSAKEPEVVCDTKLEEIKGFRHEPFTLYESSSIKMENNIMYFLIIGLVLLSLLVVFIRV